MLPVASRDALGALHPVEAILYLESASFVTGEILHVDGVRARVADIVSEGSRASLLWRHKEAAILPACDPGRSGLRR